MLKKALGFMAIACLAAMVVIFSAGTTAGAAETSRPPMTAELLASPKCSSSSAGPIRYQLCVRYNCDTDSCAHRAYLGLTNTTTGSRTVTYALDWRVNNSDWEEDMRGTVRLGPGEQAAIVSPNTHETACDVTVHWRLTVDYGSGPSSPLYVSAALPCA
jgi:hypothetical protein